MKLENHLQQLTVKQKYITDKISSSKHLIIKHLLLLIVCLICLVAMGLKYYETNEIKFLVLAILIIIIPIYFLSSKLIKEVKYHKFLIEDVNFLKNDANNVFSGEIHLSNGKKITGIFYKMKKGNYKEIESNTLYKKESILSVNGEN